MKKPNKKNKTKQEKKIATVKLSPKELRTLKESVKIMNEQSERLGLLDPLDAEPAMIFMAQRGRR